MAFLPWVAGAMDLWGGINQQNQSKALAGDLNNVDQQIMAIIQYLRSPQYLSSVMNAVGVEGQRSRNSLMNDLGPAIMNPSGLASDMNDQTLQAAIQAAIQAKLGGMQAGLGALQGLGGQFAQLGAGMPQGNPFGSLMQLVASGAFNKGGGTAAAPSVTPGTAQSVYGVQPGTASSVYGAPNTGSLAPSFVGGTQGLSPSGLFKTATPNTMSGNPNSGGAGGSGLASLMQLMAA